MVAKVTRPLYFAAMAWRDGSRALHATQVGEVNSTRTGMGELVMRDLKVVEVREIMELWRKFQELIVLAKGICLLGLGLHMFRDKISRCF